MICICSVAVILLFKTDAFKIVSYVPEAADINEIILTDEYTMRVEGSDTESVEKIRQLHRLFTENKTKKILYSSYFDNKLTEGKKKRKEINYERLRKIDEKINVIKLFDMLDNILL